MKLSKIEKETIILFNEEESLGKVYTYNKKLINKLDKFCEDFPESFSFMREYEDGGKEYIVSKRYISIRKPVYRPDMVKNNLNKGDNENNG